MKMMCRWLFGLLALPAAAFPADEVVVDFCTECPQEDPECCVDDTLEVVFDATGAEDDSVFEYADFVAGMRIDTAVVCETVSEWVQGWSFGVRHDTAVLSLIEDSVTVAGTDAEAVVGGFLALAGANREGTGWIGATALSARAPTELPVGERNSLAFASYTLEADAGPDGTLIRIADKEVAPVAGAHGVDVNFTISARTRLPKKLVQGLVVRETGPEVCDDGRDNDGDGDVDSDDADCEGASKPFARGDADGDGRLGIVDAVLIIRTAVGNPPDRVDCDDALDTNDDGRADISDGVALLAWLFRRGAELPEPFLACGSDPTADDLACAERSPVCP